MAILDKSCSKMVESGKGLDLRKKPVLENWQASETRAASPWLSGADASVPTNKITHLALPRETVFVIHPTQHGGNDFLGRVTVPYLR
jgi:hypothetical protein